MFVETKREGEAPARSTKSAREILLGAAEIIEQKGRAIGCLGSEAVGYCMVGAIAMASTGAVVGIPGLFASDALYRLERVIGTPNVGKWNDSHTTPEALWALRAAAAFD